MSAEKKPPGRPKRYEGDGKGAPQVRLRLEPDIHERVTTRPEGPRAYVTRLVRADMEQEQNAPSEEPNHP